MKNWQKSEHDPHFHFAGFFLCHIELKHMASLGEKSHFDYAWIIYHCNAHKKHSASEIICIFRCYVKWRMIRAWAKVAKSTLHCVKLLVKYFVIVYQGLVLVSESSGCIVHLSCMY